jgi:hypothetical protein
MAELTESQRQALYTYDVEIINSQADEKLSKLRAANDAHNTKTQAIVDKKIAAKQAIRDKRKAALMSERDKILKLIKPGHEYMIEVVNEKYDALSENVDLGYENWFDAAAEDQYKIDGNVQGRFDLAVENVEKWRQRELASEQRQLERKTQRQRKR